MTSRYDAIVLAGGRGARLGGTAKPQLSVGDATMLDRVLAAVGTAGTRVVVGPPQSVPAGVVRVQEQPPGSGPVAGLAVGLARASAGIVVVVAADLPFLSAEVIEPLLSTLDSQPATDAVLLVDEKGRDQNLLGAWRVGPLRTALAELGPLPGRAMKDLVRALRVSRVEGIAAQDAPAPWTDVDTQADLDRVRDWLRPTT